MSSLSVLITEIFTIASPVTVAYLLTYARYVINTVVLGHVGPTALAGGALGLMTCNFTGVMVILGLFSGMETLGAQAFGAGNLPRVGVILQRSILISACWIVVCGGMWFYIDKGLVLLGQDSNDAKLAQRYALVFLTGLPALVGYEGLRRFLQSQSINTPMVYTMLVSVPFHAFACWTLTFHFHLGFIGVPTALVLTCYLEFFLLLAFIVLFHPHAKGTWEGWSVAVSLQGWSEYLKLGIPGVFMAAMEWGCFELMSLLAGILGTSFLAAHSIIVNLVVIAYMFPLGLGIAVNVLAGQKLGEGRPVEAKWTSYYALMMGIGIAAAFALTGILFRSEIVSVFTADPTVQRITTSALLVGSFFPLFDATQGIGQGILKAAGKQATGALINCLGSYGVGLPTTLYLTFMASGQLFGLWSGMVVGYCALAGLSLVVVSRYDWQKEAVKAKAVALQGCDSLKVVKDEITPLLTHPV